MREQLEAALAAEWTYDNLAVYSDFLQSHGEPRGELIAIDLGLLAQPRSVPLVKRRAAILDDLLDDWREMPTSWFQLGFVYPRLSSNSSDALQAILESPFAPYLRDVAILGPATWIKRFFSGIAKLEQRWLRRITIQSDDRYSSGLPIISTRAAKALIEATPSLLQIEQFVHRGVQRRPLFESFEHPRAKLVESAKDARRVVAITANQSTIDIPLNTLDALADKVDALPEPALIAWTRLRIAIDNLLARELHSVPAGWFAALLAHVDLATPTWAPWRPLREAVATTTTATLMRL
jgi:hypothetical protein